MTTHYAIYDRSETAIDDEETFQGISVSVLKDDSSRTKQIYWGYETNEVRPSEKAVRALFGELPFYFRQWALLRAEEVPK